MVDPKTLHVGSHVNYRPEGRIRLLKIDAEFVGYEYGILSKMCIDPILITPELLRELGFKWQRDSSCWRKYQINKSRYFNEDNYDWGLYISEDSMGGWEVGLFLSNRCFMRPKFYVTYLHELEGQLVYYGVELIKE